MRIQRIRTIIGLISAPALIAGGLATFTLASAGPAAAAGQQDDPNVLVCRR